MVIPWYTMVQHVIPWCDSVVHYFYPGTSDIYHGT